MELADLPVWHPQQNLIYVRVDKVKRIDASEESPVIITYTIEVGPPEFTIKGTFSQWFDPRVNSHISSTSNNKPIKPPSNDFITYTNACHSHFIKNMTLEELQDLIYERLNNRLLFGFNKDQAPSLLELSLLNYISPTSETRIKELEARLEAENWYCCDMRREHHNNS